MERMPSVPQHGGRSASPHEKNVSNGVHDMEKDTRPTIMGEPIILRGGVQPSVKGPDAWFTGTVRIDPLFPAHAPARASSASVTFEPGARTAWHTHPLGQALIVTAGVGRVQVQGGPIQEVRPGDTVWFPPQVKHWHGAAPGVSMTHISVAEEEDGNNVEWLEKVTEDQYMGNEGRCAERR